MLTTWRALIRLSPQEPIGEDSQKALRVIELHRKIKTLDKLPALPHAAGEILNLIREPMVSLSNLAQAISKDIAMTARILRAANSSYYGVPRRVDNVQLATVLLGFDQTVTLATSVAVKSALRQNSDHPQNLEQFWVHSLAVAEFTVTLHSLLPVKTIKGLYIAGLLHDVGKFILDEYFPEIYDQIQQLSSDRNISRLDAEMEVLGIDHGHIGAWLISAWNLPPEVSEAVAQHHFHPEDADPYALAYYITWADKLSYLMENVTKMEVGEKLIELKDWQEWISSSNRSEEEIIEALFKSVERVKIMADLMR
ncbi:MAG: HDOD domain-containing protein [Calditrichota bacterium]